MNSEHSYSRLVIRFFSIIALLAVISLLVFQRHQNTGYFNWRSKMWGDAVGYYIYSPAAFIYGFDASKLPEKITGKTGEGFIINETGKIVTRYSCGVAILQVPVFLAVHWIAGFTGQEQDGFSGIYHLVTSLAAILYSFLGILLLWHFLQNYFNKWISSLAVLTVFTGTNLLYYTIDATGMSHVYSFFLFALLLVLSKKYFSETEFRSRLKYFIPLSIISSLIILIRPTNLAFVGLVFLLDIRTWQDFTARLRQVFTPANIAILVVSFFLVFLPQMIYWNYSSGSVVTDSYAGYGFTNWASPKIREFLFSTNNGLFTYNPLYFMVLAALVFMIVKKEMNGWFILAVFGGLIYVFSSWFIFSFGCGFGSRNFVEYTTIFALPLGYLFQHSIAFLKWIRRFMIFITVLFVLINIKLVSAYDKCFLGKDWDLKEYSYYLKSRKLNKRTLYFKSELLTSTKEFSKGINVDLKNSALVNFRRAVVSVDAEIYSLNSEASIVVAIVSNDSTIYWNGYPLKSSYNFNKLGEKQRIIGDFWFPREFTTNSVLSAYIWNMNKDSLQVSRIKIHLE